MMNASMAWIIYGFVSSDKKKIDKKEKIEKKNQDDDEEEGEWQDENEPGED